MGHSICHTVCARGKRVAVQLKNGQLVEGRFLRRAKNNRWIEISTGSEDEYKSIILDLTETIQLHINKLSSHLSADN